MKIILGEKTEKLDVLAKKIKGIIASEMCGIKFIKEEVDLFIPYNKILDDGFIENTSINIEEVLITLKIRNIYYGFENSNYLLDCAELYQVKIYTDYSV